MFIRIGTFQEAVGFLNAHGFVKKEEICQGCRYNYCFYWGHGNAFAGNSKADILRKINDEYEQGRISKFIDER